MLRILRLLPVLLLLVAAPGCGLLKGNAKKAATTALAAAEQAYAKIQKDANDVAPDAAREIEAAIASAHQALDAGDFDGVTKDAKALVGRIETLAQSLPALREQLQADWKELLVSVPGALAAVDKKLDDEGQPPKGMPGRDKYDAVNARLGQLLQSWDEARSHAASGQLARGVQMGHEIKDEAVKLVTEFQQGS